MSRQRQLAQERHSIPATGSRVGGTRSPSYETVLRLERFRAESVRRAAHPDAFSGAVPAHAADGPASSATPPCDNITPRSTSPGNDTEAPFSSASTIPWADWNTPLERGATSEPLNPTAERYAILHRMEYNLKKHHIECTRSKSMPGAEIMELFDSGEELCGAMRRALENGFWMGFDDVVYQLAMEGDYLMDL